MCPFVITIFNCLNLSNLKYHAAIDITFLFTIHAIVFQNLCLLSMSGIFKANVLIQLLFHHVFP